MPDPIANAIHSMLDHLHAMEVRMEAMRQALEKSGIEVPETGAASAKRTLSS
jgi:serine O-acetyltransferase